MRESRDGWGEMPAGRDTYEVGDRVRGALDGLPGVVTAVDRQFDTCTVKWDGDDFPVVYDQTTIMIRRAMPWE